MTSSFAPTRSQASFRRQRNGDFSTRLRSPEAVELAPLAFGRTATAGFAPGHAWLSFHDRGGRAVIDEARRRRRGPDALVDDGRHLEDALSFHERLHAVTDLHRRRRLGRVTVHADVATAACGRRRRAARVEPDGPQPDVDPSRVRRGHSTARVLSVWGGRNCMKIKRLLTSKAGTYT